LGEQLLPAPVGEPQTIHLPDGSMLVPIARVDSTGHRTPLAGGAGSARLSAPATTGGGAAAPAPTPAPRGGGGGGMLHAAEGAHITADGIAEADGDFEPIGMLYNSNYYKRYFDGGGIDMNNRSKVEERATESTLMYLLDKEPNVDDFGISGIAVRNVDSSADADLLKVNPRARFVIDVHGIQGDGTKRSIPTVMNTDGATFTDPRFGRG
jgi:hypothetical protein